MKIENDKLKIIFPTAFRYPSLPAEWRFGLEQARGFAVHLGADFLYIVERVDDPEILRGVPYLETRAGQKTSLRRLHLLTLYNFFWLLRFFLTHPEWRTRSVVLYVTERKIGLVALLFRIFFRFPYRIIFDSHGHEERWLDIFLYNRSDYIIFPTHNMYRTALDGGTIRKNQPVSIFPAAVNLVKFKHISDDRILIRKELELPLDKKILMQAGRYKALGYDKGVKNLIEVISHIKDKNVVGCFVGGTKDEIKEAVLYAEKFGVRDRCMFVAFVDEHKILRYLKAADILVYIPPPEKFFLYENSPMKLFEFMASSRPIVLADYPGLREGLDDESALFVPTHNLKFAAIAIESLLKDNARMRRMGELAFRKIIENTWEKRAEKILAIAKTLL